MFYQLNCWFVTILLWCAHAARRSHLFCAAFFLPFFVCLFCFARSKTCALHFRCCLEVHFWAVPHDAFRRRKAMALAICIYNDFTFYLFWLIFWMARACLCVNFLCRCKPFQIPTEIIFIYMKYRVSRRGLGWAGRLIRPKFCTRRACDTAPANAWTFSAFFWAIFRVLFMDMAGPRCTFRTLQAAKREKWKRTQRPMDTGQMLTSTAETYTFMTHHKHHKPENSNSKSETSPKRVQTVKVQRLECNGGST